MQVSDAVVDRLAAHGIDAVFGIPGKQTLPLDAAVAAREDLRHVVARHETAVSHQAWGYAETTGRPAATLVVPGPGDLNAANGLKNAANDCTPLVHLAVETDPDVRGGDGIHETPPETYDPLVKTNALVERPQATVAVLEEAIRAALTPPTGPVRVGIPKSFLTAEVPLATPQVRDPPTPPSPPGDAIVDAADRLAEATAPVVVAGGGVRVAGASDALRRVARALDAPVVTTYKGKGVIPDDHPLAAGTLAGSAPPALLDLLAAADAALAVGTDLDAVATRQWAVELPDELVHVTLDPAALARGYEPTVPIVADAGATLDALVTALGERGRGSGETTEHDGDDDEDDETDGNDGVTPGERRAATVRTNFDDRVADLRGRDPPLSSVAALAAVREAVPREAVVSADAGGFRVWALNAFPAAGPRRYVNPGSWASMGTGLPAGIGAQVGNPDADVVVLTGDGGLLMCVHELHTVAAEDLPLTVVTFANQDYAIISEEARRRYDLAGYDWADAPVDVVALAESLGVEAVRAETPKAIRDAVERGMASDDPALVAVTTDPDEPQARARMTRDR